ncbi:GerAB/ArcD/ProY family transporter [Falsibacillus pallidus]|uniref:Spore germination protein (Amino acid permease) n=1 Tax=Falsibacillus pallidus TaxID=493781 RepID=A0A370G2S1_9BACI|nr:GerAB/ArcD/ProY family transporter [Falsibacillus pallidus]RDI38002.1 spore germination protein (amino acid permease) [Falsibacillus pallidus]
MDVGRSDQVSSFLMFFLIHSIQIGVGILGFERAIILQAGNDAWMVVIIAGLLFNGVIWMMYALLKNDQSDLADLHRNYFGKWVGGFLTLIWSAYWFAMGITVIRTYMEVVQTWMFKEISVFFFSLILVLLVYYGLSGGFRIVAGICFLGVVVPFYLILTFIFPFKYAHFHNLLPIFNHSINQMLMGTKNMTLSYLGISTFMMFYPYIKDPEKSQKWAHFGNFLTMFIYLFVIITAIAYYSEAQIVKQIWATLYMWKIVSMPFVERFEYIGITSWVLVILPNVCLSLWAAVNGSAKIFKISPKIMLFIFMLLALICCTLLNGKNQIELLNKYLSLAGLILISMYLPVLLIITKIIAKVRRGRSLKSGS